MGSQTSAGDGLTSEDGPDASGPPRVTRVLETALYCDDLAAAVDFYERVLGLRVMSRSERLIPLDAGGGTVLLLFKRGSTAQGLRFGETWIPPHDGHGPVHVALAVAQSDLERWAARLAAAGVVIESRFGWNRGGTSLYFRDPDGHSIELASPGVWDVY